jgi:hypothetical protein
MTTSFDFDRLSGAFEEVLSPPSSYTTAPLPVKPKVALLPLFTKNTNLVAGGEIGTIVKHYLGKNFNTYEDFLTVVSRKFHLSKEERRAFDKRNKEGKEWIFEKGNAFEAHLTALLREKCKDTHNVIDYNEGEKTILSSEELGFEAIPDLLLRAKDGSENILCEIKGAVNGAKNTENYKYQVVAQSMLLREYLNAPITCKIFFEKPNSDGEKVLAISTEERERIENEIKTAIKMLRQDMESEAIKFLSFTEMMKRFEAPAEIEIDDEQFIKAMEESAEFRELKKASESADDAFKKILEAKFKGNVNAIFAGTGGQKYEISYTISSPTCYTEEDRKEAIKKAEAIQIGSFKSEPKKTLKIQLI